MTIGGSTALIVIGTILTWGVIAGAQVHEERRYTEPPPPTGP